MVLAYGNARLRKVAMVMLRQLAEIVVFPERRSQEFFTAYLTLLDTHTPEPETYGGELLKLTQCVFGSAHTPAHTHTHTF